MASTWLEARRLRAAISARRDAVGISLTVVLFAELVLLMTGILGDPARIEQLTVDNTHPWGVHVAVNDDDGGGWVGLGVIDPQDQRTFTNVLDQGDIWIIEFDYAGHAFEQHSSRAQLEAESWTITVPDGIADRLRAAGVPETPT